MDAYKSLPEPAKVGLAGAALGGALSLVMDEGASPAMFAVSQGAMAAAASYIAPMLIADKMSQTLGAAAVGAAGGYVLPAYVPGGAIVSGGIAGGALYLSRMAS
jgi:hypothetical protein